MLFLILNLSILPFNLDRLGFFGFVSFSETILIFLFLFKLLLHFTQVIQQQSIFFPQNFQIFFHFRNLLDLGIWDCFDQFQKFLIFSGYGFSKNLILGQ